MKSASPLFLRAGLAAAVLVLAGGHGLAADKKDDPKAPDKKGGDPKAAAKAAPPATNTVSLVVAFPKSVFNTTLEAGRDPFFPASKRRFPKPAEVKPPEVKVIPPPAGSTNPVVKVSPPTVNPSVPGTPTTNAPSVTPTPPPDLIGSANLSLRGIVGNKTRKWATIHTGAKSYDFLKGEEMLIRLPNDKTLKVRCVDIRERSAVFQAEGEPHTKELFLREGL